jgi:hypothetical protein
LQEVAAAEIQMSFRRLALNAKRLRRGIVRVGDAATLVAETEAPAADHP